MEIIDEHGELCAFCSDDPQDFIHIPPVEAIRLLTLKYIEQCGVSLGMRTLYYNAAEAWQEILASTPNHPLAKPAEELMLYELMPMICEAYKPELYDKYDITYLDDDKLLALYEKAQKDCDEQTAHEILCGNHDFKLSEIVRLVGADGFFETVDGLRKYLESIADEADKFDLDEKRKLITVEEKPTYCQGLGCYKLGSCLRHSMFEKDGWFNGIRIVDENQCIENNFKMYKEQTL